ncbi:hypothetical protein GWK17_05730 [Bacillus selenatarsenatis]|uniref:Uncharacterized protein n=1 Tax=Mesobacillus selenatarsenatis TaxID=388741 RepID=A0A846TLM6_9BACI|nr:hypothetical protein [Mesobacillus selenatarsenatis]
MEAGTEEKCPIERLYRTNGSLNGRKVSDRRALSDKQKLEQEKNVR